MNDFYSTKPVAILKGIIQTDRQKGESRMTLETESR